MLFLFSFYTHVSLCMQSLFLFHTWYLDEFCLSVSERQVAKVYLAMNSLLAHEFSTSKNMLFKSSVKVMKA